MLPNALSLASACWDDVEVPDRTTEPTPLPPTLVRPRRRVPQREGRPPDGCGERAAT
jgi:hypothetical protein